MKLLEQILADTVKMASPPLRRTQTSQTARNQTQNNNPSRRQLFSDDNVGTEFPNATFNSSLLKEIVENQKKLLEQNEKLLAAQQDQSRQTSTSHKIEVPTGVKVCIIIEYIFCGGIIF